MTEGPLKGAIGVNRRAAGLGSRALPDCGHGWNFRFWQAGSLLWGSGGNQDSHRPLMFLEMKSAIGDPFLSCAASWLKIIRPFA